MNMIKEDKNEEELESLLRRFSAWLAYLQYNVPYLSYSYMYEYFNLLRIFSHKIRVYSDLSVKELELFYEKFSTRIYLIPSLLQPDENQYQKEILSALNVFTEDKGNMRDITLEVLEKDFPEYYKHAQAYIKELEQQEPK